MTDLSVYCVDDESLIGDVLVMDFNALTLEERSEIRGALRIAAAGAGRYQKRILAAAYGKLARFDDFPETAVARAVDEIASEFSQLGDLTRTVVRNCNESRQLQAAVTLLDGISPAGEVR